MTDEPPEGPSPEDSEGPDWEEMVAEVLRRAHQLDDEEQFEALDDDILLDRLGGASGDVPGEERSELTDMLGAWRDDVESEPVPPIAERAQQIHEFSKEIERATRPPQEGTPHVTAMETAEQIRSLGYAAYERALQALNGLDEHLDAVMGQLTVSASAPDESTNAASSLLGEGHPGIDDILQGTAGWVNALDPLKGMVTQLKGMVSEVTGSAQHIPDGFNAAANRVAT